MMDEEVENDLFEISSEFFDIWKTSVNDNDNTKKYSMKSLYPTQDLPERIHTQLGGGNHLQH